MGETAGGRRVQGRVAEAGSEKLVGEGGSVLLRTAGKRNGQPAACRALQQAHQLLRRRTLLVLSKLHAIASWSPGRNVASGAMG